MNLQEAVDRYTESAGESDLTRSTYRSALGHFISYVGTGKPCKVLEDREEVEKYVADVKKRKYAPATFALYLTVVRSFVNWLAEETLVTYEATRRIDKFLARSIPKHVRKLPRIPSQDDVQAVIDAAYSSPLPSPFKERNIAIVEVMACSGCRIREISLLRVGDIDAKKREAIVTGKGNRERKVYFSPTAVNACLRYWKARKDTAPTSPVFARHDDGAGKKIKPMATRSLRTVVDQLAMVAGVKNFTPHKFRHVFATRMLEETSDLSIVQDALGHQSPQTTRIYARTNPEMVRRAHQQIWR